MIKLKLKDGVNEIIAESKDARFDSCLCYGLSCKECPFGISCARDFCDMSFGDAMELRKEKIDEMVEEIIECDFEVEEQEESKKKYTFEFTDEQAVYLHAFMNRWETGAIRDTLDVMGFFEADNPPFVTPDNRRIPKEWHDDNRPHIVTVMHDLSYEIYNKLSEQRGFEEE